MRQWTRPFRHMRNPLPSNDASTRPLPFAQHSQRKIAATRGSLVTEHSRLIDRTKFRVRKSMRTRMNLARFPRRRYTNGTTPLEKMHTPSRWPEYLFQTRRSAWPYQWREQYTETRVPRRRCTCARCRYADHRRRGAVQSLPPDTRRSGEGRTTVPPSSRGAGAWQL